MLIINLIATILYWNIKWNNKYVFITFDLWTCICALPYESSVLIKLSAQTSYHPDAAVRCTPDRQNCISGKTHSRNIWFRKLVISLNSTIYPTLWALNYTGPEKHNCNIKSCVSMLTLSISPSPVCLTPAPATAITLLLDFHQFGRL